jgi:hypothetical protein
MSIFERLIVTLKPLKTMCSFGNFHTSFALTKFARHISIKNSQYQNLNTRMEKIKTINSVRNGLIYQSRTGVSNTRPARHFEFETPGLGRYSQMKSSSKEGDDEYFCNK